MNIVRRGGGVMVKMTYETKKNVYDGESPPSLSLHLNSLSESHFVSKNAVETVVIQRNHPLQALELGGGVRIGKGMNKQKSSQSTLLADSTRGLITTKQTKPRPVASPHPITPAYSKI